MSDVHRPTPGYVTARPILGSLLMLSVLVLIVGPISTDVARADCIGPTFSNTGGDLAHGDLITVTGYGFGDNCYDTGPPPPGEGSLGRPLTEIEIYVEQDGRLVLAALGNANDDYIWEVQIEVPAVLDVGEAHVVVMNDGFEAFNENPAEIWVTSDRAEEAFFEPVAFGPPVEGLTAASPEAAFRGTDWTPLIAIIAVTALVVAGVWLIHRRSAQ